jgi:hypothetical protein
MLVVVVPHLVVSFAVAQVDPPDSSFAFHGGYGTKDGRIVGSTQSLSRCLVKLVERPCVANTTNEKALDGVGDGTRARHVDDHTTLHITCPTRLCNTLA